MVNVTWYDNGTQVQFNSSVTGATYTNTSVSLGTRNVSAFAENVNGTVMQTWGWNVANTTESISISFIDTTPANGTTQASSYAYINTTISDTSSTTAFIDWNRSLIGWWRFNNEIGETSSYFKDWSNWGNDGTCSGTTCPISTPGRFGTALNFDGSNDYVDVGTGSDLDINDAITVETWINTSENKAVQFIAGRGDTGYSGWFLSWEEGTIQFKVGSGSAEVRPVYPGNQINTWYHVVGTYDRTSAKLYINGENKDTVPFTSPINYGSIARTWIGQIPGGGGTPARYFNGKIDEVRIYNRSLSPEEINASYNAGVYRLYRNFTNLPEGVYNYKAFVQNATGIVSQTETRLLTLTTGPVPLSITGFSH